MLISQTSAFNDSFKSVWIEPLMIWDGKSALTVRHADMLASYNDLESCFTECPDSSVRRDISKEYPTQIPLLHKPLHLWSLQISS